MDGRTFWASWTGLVVVLTMLAGMAVAAERGPVTNLPMPRYVSMKATEGNVRRGPSLDHRIDWVYHRKDLPLRIVDEYGHWRRVQDLDGQGGWVHYSLLSGVRTAIVTTQDVALRSRPNEAAHDVALAEQGVVGRLDSCEADWCQLRVGRHRGWIRKAALWGVGEAETFD